MAINLGTLLNERTLPLHQEFQTGFVASLSIGLPKQWYPVWKDKHRTLLGRSCEELRDVAELGLGLGSDTLAFNLERGKNNDPWEIEHPIEAMKDARTIADDYGLSMMPAMGGSFADTLTDEQIAQVANFADGWWLLQAQRQQTYPAGETFKAQVAARLDRAMAGNPGLNFVVQLSTWAGYPVSASQLYRWVASVKQLSLKYPIQYVSIYDGNEVGDVVREVMLRFYNKPKVTWRQ